MLTNDFYSNVSNTLLLNLTKWWLVRVCSYHLYGRSLWRTCITNICTFYRRCTLLWTIFGTCAQVSNNRTHAKIQNTDSSTCDESVSCILVGLSDDSGVFDVLWVLVNVERVSLFTGIIGRHLFKLSVRNCWMKHVDSEKRRHRSISCTIILANPIAFAFTLFIFFIFFLEENYIFF